MHVVKAILESRGINDLMAELSEFQTYLSGFQSTATIGGEEIEIEEIVQTPNDEISPGSETPLNELTLGSILDSDSEMMPLN